jgi:transposase
MMRVQDVLLKAMAKKLTWSEAAEIIGVTERTMRRWRERLETDGYSGFARGTAIADQRAVDSRPRRFPVVVGEV